MWRWGLALVLSAVLAAGVTGPKLYKMARIKGWLPGADVVRVVITQKGVDAPRGRREFEDSYWVSWAKGDPQKSWTERDRVGPDVWENIRVGDTIEVVRVPGESRAYLRNGVFVEPGNFAFDLVLFAAALGVAFASAGRLLWWRFGGSRTVNAVNQGAASPELRGRRWPPQGRPHNC